MADEVAVARFVDITGSTAENARFFLEATNNDVERAIESFFENGAPPAARRSGGGGGGLARNVLAQDEDDEDEDDSMFDAAVHNSPARASGGAGGPPPFAAPASGPSGAASSGSGSGSSSNRQSSQSSSRIRSFRDIANDDDHDHDHDEERQEFFAGGKSSGVAVQGGPKRAQDAIGGILKAATATGRREQEEGIPPPSVSSSARRPQPTFRGTGHRLGESMDEPSTAPTAATTAGSAAAAGGRADEPDPDEALNHTLVFWQNGFSIDDGPLREYTDPANVQFLDEINHGRVPAELRARFGQRVNIAVQQRLQDKYVPPPKVLKPFSGQGNRLGSLDEPPAANTSTSAAATAGTTTTTAAAAAAVPASAPAAAAAAPTVPLNESEAVTTLQLRLADGTRMVARFNHTHTVADIRTFINRAKPGDSQRNYALQTTFPNRELSDPSLTLVAAGLLNAVVVQRYT